MPGIVLVCGCNSREAPKTWMIRDLVSPQLSSLVFDWIISSSHSHGSGFSLRFLLKQIEDSCSGVAPFRFRRGAARQTAQSAAAHVADSQSVSSLPDPLKTFPGSRRMQNNGKTRAQRQESLGVESNPTRGVEASFRKREKKKKQCI